jgi:hypothetical protein
MRRALSKVIGWIDSKWFLKTIIIPLAITVPPVVIAQAKWEKSIETFLTDHPMDRILLVSWPLLVVGVSSVY